MGKDEDRKKQAEELFSRLTEFLNRGIRDEPGRLSDPTHPEIKALADKLTAMRSDELRKSAIDDGIEVTKNRENPEGVLCGLLDYLIMDFTSSTLGQESVFADKFVRTIDLEHGYTGKYLHRLAHIVFDLGRAYELHLRQKEDGIEP